MTYIGDLAYWDDKFKSRKNRLSADPALVKHMDLLKKGRVLDIACGDGRNSIYMAQEGYSVVGIDFSGEALKKLDGYAKVLDLDIKTHKVDLSLDVPLSYLGLFDTIVINHFKLSSFHLRRLESLLEDKGTIFVTGFGQSHLVDEKIKEKDLILESDFEHLKIIHKDEMTDTRGSFVTYVLTGVK